MTRDDRWDDSELVRDPDWNIMGGTPDEADTIAAQLRRPRPTTLIDRIAAYATKEGTP